MPNPRHLYAANDWSNLAMLKHRDEKGNVKPTKKPNGMLHVISPDLPAHLLSSSVWYLACEVASRVACEATLFVFPQKNVSHGSSIHELGHGSTATARYATNRRETVCPQQLDDVIGQPTLGSEAVHGTGTA